MSDASASVQTQESPSYDVVAYRGQHLPQRYQGAVFSRWLMSLRYGNRYFRLILASSYFERYGKYIRQVIQQPDTMIRLAVLSDDHDVLLGFSVTRGKILDYVHVHRDSRRQGIGTKIVPTDIRTFTHITNHGHEIWREKCCFLHFDPFA